MSFFHFAKTKAPDTGGVSLEFLHRHECQACHLNHIPNLLHPHMQPHGTQHPDVYCIGEAPGAEEDRQGIPFVGASGKVLHFRIPAVWESRIRWNNCVRTRPPDNRNPTQLEIECCRPSIIRDIEQTKPKAIFGFGNVPLQWALGTTGITKWCGRRVPIKVGSHSCWFFPMLHPSFVMRSRKFVPRTVNEYGSEVEFQFARDLQQAFAAIDSLPPPVIHSDHTAHDNIQLFTGKQADDLQQAVDLIAELGMEDVVGFDYETAGLRPYRTNNAILSFAIAGKTRALAVAMAHPEALWQSQELEELNRVLKAFLHHAPCRKIAHNSAFEMEWSGFFFGRKCLWGSAWGDSMAQAYVLDERRGCLSLDFLCQQYFGIQLKALSNLDRSNLANVPISQVLTYNAIDAKYHRLLYFQQLSRLREAGLLPVYKHHMQRIPACVLTQLKGVPIDQTISKQFHRRYNKRLQKIEDKIASLKCVQWFKKHYQHEFRPSSLHDLNKVLQHLNIQVDKLDEKALLPIKHPISKLVLRWREHNKLLSTYVLPFMQGAPTVYPDGLLHPILSTMKTRTWRTSAEDPNIQNQPKRDHIEVRAQVRPGNKRYIVAFDYAGIQARNIAMESCDKVLVKAFIDWYDIHEDWRDRIIKAYPKWLPNGKQDLQDKSVMKALRSKAKNGLVFPLFFGAQAKKVALVTGIPEPIAQKLREEFMHEFAGVDRWHKKLMQDYYKSGYVTGLSGFRRRAPISPNEIINAPIQADESLIVMEAFAALSKYGDPRLQPNMEIHDDLTFVLKGSDVDRCTELIIGEMLRIRHAWINVPLVVEMSLGVDWARVQPVGTFESTGTNSFREVK